jgi:hypothetical protein
MAVPLWRQYSRLSREERDEILRRRRGRLDEAASQEEILEAFEQDAQEVREAYRDRVGGGAREADDAAAAVDRTSRFAQRQEMLNSVSDPTDRAIADTVTTRNQNLDVATVPARIAELRRQRKRDLALAYRAGEITPRQYRDSNEDNVVNNWVQTELITNG